MKLCECGCGEPAPIAKKTDRKLGYVKGGPKRFIYGHVLGSGEKGIHWKGGKTTLNGYVAITEFGHPHADSRGRVLEHVYLASKALGKPLPPKAQVHHVDENRKNNEPGNLVLCEDQAFHYLLHRRQRAFDACGHASWLWCSYCQSFDDPKNMIQRQNGYGGYAYHQDCVRTSNRERYRRKNGLADGSISPQE